MLRDESIGEILVQADELQHRVRQMGAEITRDYEGKDLLLIGVLKGAVRSIDLAKLEATQRVAKR